MVVRQKDFNKETVAQWLVYILAVVGLIQVAGSLVQTFFGVIGSFILMSVSAFGVVWLGSIARKGKFKSKETIISILLIVGGIFLYKFAPDAFPGMFSLLLK